MRKFIGAVVCFGALIFFFASEGYSQKGKKGGGFPGGGGGDPSRFFDMVARGQPVIDLNTTESKMKDSLMDYAKVKGISNNKITREQFVDFMEWRKVNGLSGGPKVGGPGKGIPGKGGPTPVDPTEAWNDAAEKSFNLLDTNGDKYLVKEEMPKYLLDVMDKWDKDKDGKLDLPEYKAFYISRMRDSLGKDFNKFNASANPIATIIIEEDWDRRPVVLRAGHLHKDLPKWFSELDKNKDGQVSLAEWMDAKKEYDEFVKYDRNDDGLLTQEEVLRREALVKAGQDGKENPTLALGSFDFTKPGISSGKGRPDGSKKGMFPDGGKKKKKGG
jgi:Ca2+-binding EF-hand superfamily protein